MSSITVSSQRPRILSGVQPSGKLHLGNYFGASNSTSNGKTPANVSTLSPIITPSHR